MKQVDLSDIGVKKSLFDDLKTPDINGIIVDWGNDLITALRDKLAKNKSNASGSLSANIKPVIRASAKGVNYIVLMNDYYINVEEGQQPKQVAYKDILQWMKEKRRYGVFKSAFNKGIESVIAKIIVRNIGERGTKAKPFIAPTLNQKRLDTLSQSIADHLAQKIFT
jgi:hypothetical protein